MKYNIGMVSLGCAKNLTDTETMLGILDSEGFEIVSELEEADVIIVNTCGFIESAKQESIDTILEMAEYKKNRCKLLIVTGCLAERYNTQVIDEFPEIDALCGVGDYPQIAKVITEAFEGKKPVLFGNENEPIEENLPRITATAPHVAYIKIAEGCDNNCTYCAIPEIRGHYRSRRIEDIVAEAEKLAENGVRELIVIAQDTTRYGKDIYGEYNLHELLLQLCKIEKIKWMRVHYYYTEAIRDEFLVTMAENEKICNYIDMPIQHINNDILRRMARRTNRAEIEAVIKRIRELMPDAVIRTSIITGFPGETDEQFNELYEFLEEYRLDRVGVFTYSPEEGTPAAGFSNQIDEEVKNERLDILMKLQQKISLIKNREKLETEIEVITEGFDEECMMYYGRSRGDSLDVDQTVYFGAEFDIDAGDIVKVKVLNYSEYELMGQMTGKVS